MQGMQNEDIVQSRQVIEMLTVANEYCLFFERAEKYSRQDILTYFNHIAPLLYLKASLLPETDLLEETLNERYVTEEQWEGIFKTLHDILGKDALYQSLDVNNDLVEASLADNMADAYQDLKDFVMLFQKNHFYAKESAVASIKSLFRTHWGPILLNALKACHEKLYTIEKDDNELFPDASWVL